MLETLSTRSGHTTVRLGDTLLHSSFNPKREAERYIDKSLCGKVPSLVLVCGPGMGYIIKAVKKRYPYIRCIGIWYSEAMAQLAGYAQTPDMWHPGGSDSLSAFLFQNLSELEIEGVQIITWAPTEHAFPKAADRVKKSVREVFRQINGNITTIREFGARWFKNTLYNYQNINFIVQKKNTELPIVIAASGPSLEKAIPLIKKYRNSLELWALSSSVSALMYCNLKPDLIVATDAGYYASLHMNTGYDISSIPIAMPLTAKLGKIAEKQPVYLLNSSTYMEKELLNSKFSKPIAQNGTVSGTAIQLALATTSGPVIMAGLDFCYNDIISHVRPHAFDPLIRSHSGRFFPLHTAVYGRTAGHSEKIPGDSIRVSPALEIYAAWFSRFALREKRAYRLFPSSVEIPTLTDIGGKGMQKLMQNQTGSFSAAYVPLSEYPDAKARKDKTLMLLYNWNKKLERLESSDPETIIMNLTDMPYVHLLQVLAIEDVLEVRQKLRLGDKNAAAAALTRAKDYVNNVLCNAYRRIEEKDGTF